MIGAKEDTRRRLLEVAAAFARWLAVAGIAGVVCGLVGAAFYHVVSWVTAARGEHPWLLFTMPAAGLLIVWCYKAAGLENDSGTNLIIASVRGGERPRFRNAALIFISTALTHLTGGSAGREGAALQIGGGVAATLGKLFRLGEGNMNLIIMCGMSGVFTALFGTPLTATLFSMEVACVGVLQYSALFPCLLTSLVSMGVVGLLHVEPEGYALLGMPALGWESCLRVGALAAACALLSILFCVLMHRTAHLYKKYITSQYIRAAAGAALIVLLTLLEGSGDYNGAGGGIIELAMEGELRTPMAFLFKMVFTALTLGAGFRGGEIVPTFFVGATFGCAAAPLLGLSPSFGAAVGLTAMFCGVVNCPVASMFLSIELFGGEGLLFFALACAISFLLSGRFSLYSAQKLAYSKVEPKYVDEDAR